MAKYYNTSIAKDVQRIFNFKQSDTLGSDVGSMIVPVINIQRITDFFLSDTNNTTGTKIALTTPINKDLYITGFTFSAMTDAACDNTTLNVRVKTNQTDVTLIEFNKLSLTAFAETKTVTFSNPIKVDRGSNMTSSTSYSVGACKFGVQFYGYYVETQTAQ